MTINVNNQSQSISKESTIKKLLEALDISTNGIAVAVNNEVISKESWGQIILNEKDEVTIIQATQGG